MTAHTRARAGAHGARGAALLAALLTVALVATLASAGLWKQWRAIEVEAAERERAQSGWVLAGALDWARLILREDARAGKADHLDEPWAVPLREARLSTFLAADRGADTQGTSADATFLSGEIIDLHARLNVNDLLESGRVSGLGLTAFQRLFNLLGLPQSELETMVAKLQLAASAQGDDGSPDPAGRAQGGQGAGGAQGAGGTGTGTGAARAPGEARTEAAIPLMPRRVEQLGWLGLSPATIAALRPHITVLPGRTQVNVNTASVQVIYAAIGGIGMVDAQRIVAARQGRPLQAPADVTRLLMETPGAVPVDGLLGVSSRFFEVRARLRLERTVIEERTLVQRVDSTVRVLQRERGVRDPAAAPAASPGT